MIVLMRKVSSCLSTGGYVDALETVYHLGLNNVTHDKTVLGGFMGLRQPYDLVTQV